MNQKVVLITGAYCASKAAFTAWSETLRLEHRPFNIKVVKLQPGGIKSNFGISASRYLAFDEDKSVYAPISAFIRKKTMVSQQHATPAEEFARKLVTRLLVRNPDAIIRIGKSSRLNPAMKRWILTVLLDRLIAHKFGLDRL
jgi:short-subunit dehydrogenase